MHASRELVQLPFVLPRSWFPVRFRPATRMGDEELFQLCAANSELRIERTAQGEIIVMSPTGGQTSRRNSALTAALYAWATKDGTGVTFDSSGAFLLPSGAERAPDVSWVHKARWDALTDEQRERFPPLCPDFVVELVSPSDALGEVQAKMREYMDNGARLGWLIDPGTRRVWVYRPAHEAVCLESPTHVDGAQVLPGFVLELATIW
jgi:Uma2 family endonuclease